jgi:hypothetical protein
MLVSMTYRFQRSVKGLANGIRPKSLTGSRALHILRLSPRDPDAFPRPQCNQNLQALMGALVALLLYYHPGVPCAGVVFRISGGSYRSRWCPADLA